MKLSDFEIVYCKGINNGVPLETYRQLYSYAADVQKAIEKHERIIEQIDNSLLDVFGIKHNDYKNGDELTEALKAEIRKFSGECKECIANDIKTSKNEKYKVTGIKEEPIVIANEIIRSILDDNIQAKKDYIRQIVDYLLIYCHNLKEGSEKR